MYNNIQAVEIKGTGLSGYVQRSKATVNVRLNRPFAATASNVEDTMALSDSAGINPLLAQRSQKENEECARRLAAHNAIRQVKLKVLLYKEERIASGIPHEVVEREAEEMYKSLMHITLNEQRQAKKLEDAKSAERFAAAFGVKHDPHTFDREVQEQRKAEQEVQRRQAMEQKLVEKVKKMRREQQQEEEVKGKEEEEDGSRL